MRSFLNGDNPGHGKRAYYLVASGSVAWDDVYAAVAKALHEGSIIKNDSVVPADETGLKTMAKGLGTDNSLITMRLVRE
ncbi:uncharacterized protein ColSpa_00405 [Colletotrichum spaethianum]|uniref:Uncharacterized protein n=1 Tax=Colletotrichum spaethianum TaxID=700344 RepID=A0AA37L461_9PEZI|nr:uncharacterized protein ColSpa_00405 [Colletotrichum spaethianum]GKT40224.1 hypothetical protein ColSpa_00405 [Colletotrichum spaethianum]